MTPELVTAFGNFGPMGLLVLFLYFEKKAEREHRREVEDEKVKADLARAQSDKEIATALTALTVTIQHLPGGR